MTKTAIAPQNIDLLFTYSLEVDDYSSYTIRGEITMESSAQQIIDESGEAVDEPAGTSEFIAEVVKDGIRFIKLRNKEHWWVEILIVHPNPYDLSYETQGRINNYFNSNYGEIIKSL